MTARIIVFAKAPAAGRVKTRLIPRLGAAGAAELHVRLIGHALRAARDAALGPVELCADGWNASLEAAVAAVGATRSEQGDGDLGARMARAIERGLSRDPNVILIGTDCVALDAAYLRAAAQGLAAADAVFGPAEDGGYVLVAMRRLWAEAFDRIEWSTERVMAQTRERLLGAGASWSELRTLWDIDRPEDYDRLVASGIPILG